MRKENNDKNINFKKFAIHKLNITHAQQFFNTEIVLSSSTKPISPSLPKI